MALQVRWERLHLTVYMCLLGVCERETAEAAKQEITKWREKLSECEIESEGERVEKER